MTGQLPSVAPRFKCALKPAYLALAAVVAVFVALSVYVLDLAYQRQEQAAFATADNLTRVIAERLEATLRRADNDLRVFVEFLPKGAMQSAATSRFRPHFEAQFRAQLAQFPELSSRNVIDAHGNSLYYSGPVKPGTNYSDRDWFRALRDHPQTESVISDVIAARATGKPTLVMSRAVRDHNGRFLGTVNATINLQVLGSMLESLDIGPGGLIVVRKKGVNKLVLRHPPRPELFNTTVNTETYARINAGEKFGRTRSVSPLDGIPRATVFRVLEGFPFSISVGIAKDYYLQEWRRIAAITGIAGFALLVFLIAFVVMRVRSETRLTRLARQLKQSESALRTNEQFLREVIESISDGILVEDTGGRVLATNRRFHAMWHVPAVIAGLGDRRLLNRHMAMLLEDPAKLPTSVAASGNGDIVNFAPLELRDGRRIEPDAGTLRRDGELAGRVWSFHDVTERKRTHHMYRSIIESSADAFIAFDAGLRITAVSLRAEQVFGCAGADIVGRTLAETILPDAEAAGGILQTLLTAVRAGDTATMQRVCRVQAQRMDGREFPAEIQVGGFAMGDDWQYTSFVRDISARVLAEEKLAQAQKLEAIGQLTGGLAHDFNNLLNIIIGSVDLLELERRDNRELRDAALSAARRGSEVTKSLLAVARRTKLSPREVCIDDLINEIAPLLHQTAGKRVTVHLDAGSAGARVHVDAGGFSTVMLNLAINARDAMPQGGELFIRTTITDGKKAAGESRSVLIAVTDTGCGMPPEIAARAFEPFFTTKSRGSGTGLGLAMAYAFARESGGTATIASRPGAGTTIELTLPALRVTAVATTSAAVAAERGRGETVLLVDDEPDLARVARQWLISLGYRVVAETDAQRAFQRLADEPFDALVSDVVMPGGINGVMLAERAAFAQPGIAIMLVSGYADSLLESIHGKFALLDKPYNREQLGAALRAALDRRPHSARTPPPMAEKSAA